MPVRALDWLHERRVATQDIWDALSNAGKQRAWWITGLSENQIGRAAREIMDALAASRSEYELLAALERLGISVTGAAEPGADQIASWHARLVYKTARDAGYHADNWMRMRDEAASRPYAQWLCGEGPCPICEPNCGVVAPLDLWSDRAPQLHLGCNCELVNVSDIEARREGLSPADALPENPLAPPDWAFNRDDAYYLESAGGVPATDAGRADAALLATLAVLGA
jgi:hypothetical protein